jgi:tRNA A-37 threonylcarbamoyl transferase component Bud32
VADPVNASAATCQLDTKALSAAKIDRDDPLTDPLIGRDVIGQYRIEKKLGAGGMGAVYLAQQTSVQRPAVIKVLKSQLDGKLDQAARFAIEARAASNLNHPNIVTIYNYGQMEDGTLYLAMEYLEGETLEARIARCGKLPPDRAVHVASQIASALGEAHAHGVVHRDLKPANVMLVPRAGEPDFVKVLDFGIAKLDDAGVTSTGYVVGTPRYMSPEQLLGKQLDGRSDVYSAGVVLYEMLAGVTPFQSESPIGWLRQHVDVEPKPPSVLAKGAKIPPPIERVVLRALAKAPADRPASMENFALELVAALNAPTEPPRWRRAARRLGVLVVAAVLALAGAIRRFSRAAGSAALRTAKAVRSGGGSAARAVGAVGSGIRRSVKAMGAGVRRFVRALGSGLVRAARAVGTRGRAIARAIGSGVRRALRVCRSVARRLAIDLPVRIARLVLRAARATVATTRRRVLLAIVCVLAFAGATALLFPGVVDQLFAGAKPEVGRDSRDKSSHHSHAPAHAPARGTARDKKH